MNAAVKDRVSANASGARPGGLRFAMAARFERLDRWLGTIDGLVIFGRQGLFAHDNTHHGLYSARAAVDCYDGRFDHERWASYREIFATHVVED